MSDLLTIDCIQQVAIGRARGLYGWNTQQAAKQLLAAMQREAEAIEEIRLVKEQRDSALQMAGDENQQLRQALHEIGSYVMLVMQDDVGPRGATIRGGAILEIVNAALQHRND